MKVNKFTKLAHLKRMNEKTILMDINGQKGESDQIFWPKNDRSKSMSDPGSSVCSKA